MSVALRVMAGRLSWLMIVAAAAAACSEHGSRTTGAGASPTVPFSVHVLDGRSGHGIVIKSGDHEIMLDGGGVDEPAALYEYVSKTRLVADPVELAVISDPLAASWRGFRRLFLPQDGRPAPYRVLEVWEPGYGPSPPAAYTTFMKALLALPGLQLRRPLEEHFPPAVKTGTLAPFSLPTLPEFTFTVLHTDASATGRRRDHEATVVLRLDIGGIRMLFPGDAIGKGPDDPGSAAPRSVEAKLLALAARHPGALKADLLVAPYHGSESSNTREFIDAVAPRIVVFAAAPRFGLPRGTVVDRYHRPGRRLFSTGLHPETSWDHVVCSNYEVTETFDEQVRSITHQVVKDFGCGYQSTRMGDTPAWHGVLFDGSPVSMSRLLDYLPSDDDRRRMRGENVHKRTRTFVTSDATPVAFGEELRLTVDSVHYPIRLPRSQNHLRGLEKVINGLRAGVTASIEDDVEGEPQFLLVVPKTAGFLELTLLDDPRGAAMPLLRAPKEMLRGGDLRGVGLANQRLAGLDLARTDLSWSDLTGTDLSGADLTGADLTYAVARQARLIGSKLDGTKLHRADLTDAIFEPASGHLPAFAELTLAPYLRTLRFETSPHALAELREQFKKAGLRRQELDLTFAIEHGKRLKADVAEWMYRYVLEITCAYGASPWRPLGLVGVVWIASSLCYYVLIHTGGRSRLVVVVTRRKRSDPGDYVTRTRRIRAHAVAVKWSRFRVLSRLVGEARTLAAALNFGLRNTFNLKFAWLEAGTWLRMLQRRPFDFEAFGWLRTLSGVQALVSMFLIALWLLTYFGRPFE